jgi:UDP:flavonoid glycosyltransferase YjiC (YdhE family)
VVVDWLSYSQVMPKASLVICHGGHGTVARALSAGVPVLCCPHLGDMAENSARVTWAGVGLMLPWRLLGPRSLRLATRRILGDPSCGKLAAQVDVWAKKNDGSERGAELVENLS